MKRHILFIVENNPVPWDVRVWNEATAAKELGYDVSVICPRSSKSPSNYERISDIDIYRHYTPLEAAGKLGFLLEYGNALFWEFLLSFYIYVKKPFQYIHAANPPDHVFIIALFFKLLSVKFIFDHHDICPENYLAKFSRKDFFYRLLRVMEKLTFRTTNLVISTNESYKRLAIHRGGKNPHEVFVVRNGPNLSQVNFKQPNSYLKEGFRHLVVYVGVIGNQEGIENLLAVAQYVVRQMNRKDIKFAIIGTGPDWQNMVDLSASMGLEHYVRFTGFIPYDDFYEYLATADVCVNPEFANAFTDKSTMIKIMDYMTFGKPIIQFSTTEGQVTAQKASLYIQANSIEIFAQKLTELLDDPERRHKMGLHGQRRIENELNWDKQKSFLKAAYDYLDEVTV